jgi:hypothetical protein
MLQSGLSSGMIQNASLFIVSLLSVSAAGLPDGLFSNQKSKSGQILEGFRWENVDILYCHLKYFMNIGDIL